MSVDFPEPETPVTQVKVPRGNATSIPLRLCSRAPRTTSCLAAARPAARRHRNGQLARQVATGQRAPNRHDLLRRPCRHDLPAVDPGAGAQVHDPVGLPHRLLVVLDDQHGVAEVAHPPEGLEQLAVVALVKPDRRLVQHVKNAHQLGADLCGQADALRLAAGERAGGAVEGEVVEADRGHEPEPVGDLLEDLGGDHLFARGEGERPEPRQGLLDRELHDVVDGAVPDAHGQRLAPQPLASACRARTHGHEALDVRTRLVARWSRGVCAPARAPAPRTARGTPSGSARPRRRTRAHARRFRKESRAAPIRGGCARVSGARTSWPVPGSAAGASGTSAAPPGQRPVPRRPATARGRRSASPGPPPGPRRGRCRSGTRPAGS